MSGLALACASLGAEVTGSDRADSTTLDRLRAAGIRAAVGHSPENVRSGVEIVYSSAVKCENVERVRGQELGLREVRRGELLAELSMLRRCIAIAGSHGKTTTSALTAHVLRRAGVGAGYVIGAELCDGSPSAEWEQSDWLVVESDESDRTFLDLKPEIGVVTNIEAEHLNEYGSMEELREAFAAFIARCGHVITSDRSDLRGLLDSESVTTFDASDVHLDGEGARFEWRGNRVQLPIPGEHNARNAAAALEACRLAGADRGAAVRALATFPGVRRRLERLGQTTSGACIYDDYANHPNTIRATLAALRTIESGRVFVVFEPILYSRTLAMADVIGAALAEADEVAVLDIYPGSEAGQQHPDVSGRLIADAVGSRIPAEQVAWTPTPDDARAYLESALRPGDACVFMGVGPAPQKLARALLAPA